MTRSDSPRPQAIPSIIGCFDKYHQCLNMVIPDAYLKEPQLILLFLKMKKNFDLSNKEEDTVLSQLDIGIECPRCKEVMELFSKFDDVSYLCGSCHLQLSVV